MPGPRDFGRGGLRGLGTWGRRAGIKFIRPLNLSPPNFCIRDPAIHSSSGHVPPLSVQPLHTHCSNFCPKMEYFTLQGGSCLTQAEIEKLKTTIQAQTGLEVSDVRGCWIHYVHVSAQCNAKVGFPFEAGTSIC